MKSKLKRWCQFWHAPVRSKLKKKNLVSKFPLIFLLCEIIFAAKQQITLTMPTQDLNIKFYSLADLYSPSVIFSAFLSEWHAVVFSQAGSMRDASNTRKNNKWHVFVFQRKSVAFSFDLKLRKTDKGIIKSKKTEFRSVRFHQIIRSITPFRNILIKS